MTALKGSKTHANLKEALAAEALANRRYLYFAKIAEAEGYAEAAALLRDTAESEAGHAHGHLDYLRQAGDPVTGMPIGSTEQNLRCAIAGELQEYTYGYLAMAKAAREEGFAEIADWFETLVKTERLHMERFEAMLKSIT